MALVFPGKTRCILCDQPIEKNTPYTGFPAFLPAWHVLHKFSDAIVHQHCWDRCDQRPAMGALYGQYTAIWATRPPHLRTSAEFEEWGRTAFRDFPPRYLLRCATCGESECWYRLNDPDQPCYGTITIKDRLPVNGDDFDFVDMHCCDGHDELGGYTPP